MRAPAVSPTAFRRLALAALIAQAAIVVTGGAVRLTSSGLGCTTWPACTPGSLTPQLALHPLVEFGNRLLSALVGLTTLAAVTGAILRRPARRDLRLLSLGLVAGFAGQAVLGGLTVLFELRPELVMAHFLLSMLLVLDAEALWRRAGTGPGRARPLVRPEVLGLSRAIVGTAALVLLLGTVVTGAGPNSGAPAVRRLPIDLRSAAQLHSDAVLLLVGMTVGLTVLLRVTGGPRRARQRARVLLGLMLVQAAVGFTQYAVGPADARLLVGVHILGAVLFWLAALSVRAALWAAPPGSVEQQGVDRDRDEDQGQVADRGVEQPQRMAGTPAPHR